MKKEISVIGFFKSVMLTGFFLILLNSVVFAALGSVSNTANVSGAYSTAGGFPHYNVYGKSTSTDTASSSSIKEIKAEIKLYRNDVLEKSGVATAFNTNSVSKEVTTKEYGSATYKAFTTGISTYIDGTYSKATDYDSQYFNVQ